MIDSATLISLKDGTILFGFGSYSTFSSPNHTNPQKPAFYIPDFFLTNQNPWIQHSNWFALSIDEFEKCLLNTPTSESIEWTIGHHDLFTKAFTNLQKALDAGQLKKAVPYTFTYTQNQMTPERLHHSLKTALHYILHYPGYLYGHWNGSEGFLGVTPEILFSHDQQQPNTLQTMALAGTEKNKESNVSFENNPKEQAEHRLVIQGIAETFQELGVVKIGPTSVLELPTLKHLMTPMAIHLNQPFNYESAVRSMHPTPALGAFPRQEGCKWLEEYQTHLDRKNFGAPFGVNFPLKDLSFCLVAIRQVQWSNQGMRIGAGCGVVKTSVLDKEWDEIQLKIKAIRTFLSL